MNINNGPCRRRVPSAVPPSGGGSYKWYDVTFSRLEPTTGRGCFFVYIYIFIYIVIFKVGSLKVSLLLLLLLLTAPLPPFFFAVVAGCVWTCRFPRNSNGGEPTMAVPRTSRSTNSRALHNGRILVVNRGTFYS